MTFDRIFHQDWTKVIAIILTLFFGFLAAEHRQTVVEEAIAANVAAVKIIKDRQEKDEAIMLQMQMSALRQTVMLDAIDKRHAIEDEKRLK
jgi:hypothetical protein